MDGWVGGGGSSSREMMEDMSVRRGREVSDYLERELERGWWG